MYALTRGPSKLASKAGVRGTAPHIEQFESRRDAFGSITMSSAKPVFNGKSSYVNIRGTQNMIGNHSVHSEPPTAQHEENVKFIHDAWMRVQHELHSSHRREGLGPVYYQEKDPGNSREFEPIDLDQWMANRMLERIKQNS